ncbi:Transglycosylase SLT domain-containing protein [Saccharopolyspora antimicrobica]|uniref:Transglycosylase SLT domain-containing protein n=1 Tax=Saccharopolyspora antimicrobica TaxID=455193 RepID=A0A1I4U5L1_9PSEU|nr:transglycosylase SLT domain-containing protein [Saccharopolyspora antimicrobica]RKT88694.1 transglycosylase-like protein with SLT domain [Saccharopolyspora antimicrobica]SFM84239.1 Transglycosylase SLT domain-containing protein [Saccharopolyspora antimicrobica]
MPALTDQQIAQHAANAGFSGDDLQIAVAVALAESKGDPAAIGDVSLQTEAFGPSVGLWQIRSVNPGHGNAFDRAHRNEAANADPATNARNAYAIFREHGWGQWSTYTEGQYRRFMDRARNATSGGGAVRARQASNSSGFQGEIAKFFDAAAKLVEGTRKPLLNASQALSHGAASQNAFGRVQASAAAAGAHQANISSTCESTRRALAADQKFRDDLDWAARMIRQHDDRAAHAQQGQRTLIDQV